MSAKSGEVPRGFCNKPAKKATPALKAPDEGVRLKEGNKRNASN